MFPNKACINKPLPIIKHIAEYPLLDDILQLTISLLGNLMGFTQNSSCAHKRRQKCWQNTVSHSTWQVILSAAQVPFQD